MVLVDVIKDVIKEGVIKDRCVLVMIVVMIVIDHTKKKNEPYSLSILIL